MYILKYRFTAVCPSPSMEAEVICDNGKKAYVNVALEDYCPIEDVAEDGVWAYTCPMDEVDFTDPGRYYCDDVFAFDPVIRAMLRKWNGFSVSERMDRLNLPAGGCGPWEQTAESR